MSENIELYQKNLYRGKFYDKAPINPLDVPFYGELPFTTFRTFKRKLALMDGHYDRMRSSIKELFGEAVEAKFWPTYKDDEKVFVSFLNENKNGDDICARILSYPLYQDGVVKDVETIWQLRAIPPERPIELALLTTRSMRDELYPKHKTLAYTNIRMLMRKKIIGGPDDLLFFNEENGILEFSTSNFFLVRGNKIYSPALNQQILAGTTRKMILKYSQELGYEVYEQRIDKADLEKADFVFASNAVRLLIEVIKIKEIANNFDRPMFEKFKRLIMSKIEKDII